MTKTQSKSEARQRIIKSAEKLFYAEGIRAVGIDRIIAEANVAKMTLYNHFSSKDDLILAVLVYREGQFEKYLESGIRRCMGDGMNRLEAFFATLKQWFQSAGFRGCSFINAVVELAEPDHPAAQFAAAHKQKFHQMLKEMIIESAGAKAASSAPAIAMLVEGAIVTAIVEGKPEAADIAKSAAIALLPKLKTKKK